MAGCSISEYSEQSLITILYAKLLFKVLQNGYTCRGQDRGGIEEYLSVMRCLARACEDQLGGWVCFMEGAGGGFGQGRGESEKYAP